MVKHEYFNEDFNKRWDDCVHQLEVYSPYHQSWLLNFHLKHKKIATMTVVKPVARFGEVFLKGFNVKKFEEKPQLNQNWVLFFKNRNFQNMSIGNISGITRWLNGIEFLITIDDH